MKKIITFGTFDLFHIGHLNILQRAKKLGDYLIVGVSSDKMNFNKKNFYPVFPIEDRLQIIEALSCVDEVFIEESLEKKQEYILSYGANCLVMGNDWSGKFDTLKNICDIVYLPRTKDISTTDLKQRIKFPV